jgi:hypothetical protein
VEADDHRSRVVALELCLASDQLPGRNSPVPPRPRVRRPTRAPLGLPPSHRSHARDGPPEQVGALPHGRVLRRDAKAIADRFHVRADHASDPLGGCQDLRPLGAVATDQPSPASCQPEPSFVTPTGSFSSRRARIRSRSAIASASCPCMPAASSWRSVIRTSIRVLSSSASATDRSTDASSFPETSSVPRTLSDRGLFGLRAGAKGDGAF